MAEPHATLWTLSLSATGGGRVDTIKPTTHKTEKQAKAKADYTYGTLCNAMQVGDRPYQLEAYITPPEGKGRSYRYFAKTVR